MLNKFILSVLSLTLFLPSVSFSDVVFSTDQSVHVGDEEITNWSKLFNRCVNIDLPKFSGNTKVELSFEPYGLESAFINYGGVNYPVRSQQPLQGKKRPNYWGVRDTISIKLPSGGEAQKLHICAENISTDPSTIDFDDFMIRNIQVAYTSQTISSQSAAPESGQGNKTDEPSINQDALRAKRLAEVRTEEERRRQCEQNPLSDATCPGYEDALRAKIVADIQAEEKAQNIIDISELVMAETAGFPYKFADYYVNNLDNIRKDTLCNLDLYVRRGIDYCVGFLSIYTQSFGKDNVSLDLQNAVSELSKDNFAKEFKLARDSYCRIPQSKSTFENGVEDYPTIKKFGKNAKMVADGYLAECGPDIEALSTIVGEARLLNEADIPEIFEKVNVAFEANPIFIPGKIGFDEGFYWLDDQKLTSAMALEIPAGIRAGKIKRWSGIGFWGYIDDYTDEGNRIFVKLCTSSQQPCPQPVSAIIAGQPNPAFPNAALEFMSKARSFLKRSMSNKRTVQLNGFTSVFSNTGGFYIDVQNWTILR